jgi:hypothetical protein
MLSGLKISLSGQSGTIEASALSFKAVKANGNTETLSIASNSILGNSTEGFRVSQNVLDTAINALNPTHLTYPHESNYSNVIDMNIKVSANGGTATLPYLTMTGGVDTYRGELNSAANFHGQGSFLWASGDAYTGQWVNGARTGTGTLTFASGQIQSGGWSNGTRDGASAVTFDSGDVWEYTYTGGTGSLVDTLHAYAAYNADTGLIEVKVLSSDSGNWSAHAASGVDFYNSATGEFLYNLPEASVSTGKFTIDPVKLIDDYSFDSFKMVLSIADSVPSNDPFIVFDVSTISKSAAQLAQARVQKAVADAVLVTANEAQSSSDQTEAAARFSNFTSSGDTIVENDPSAVISALSVTHSSNQSLTFAIDASKYDGANFTLDGSSLKAMGSGLNYEDDNYQKVEFVVTDQDGYSVRYQMNVNVTNVDEGSAAKFGGSNYKGPVWSQADVTAYNSSNTMTTPVKNLFSGDGWGSTPGQGADLTYSFVSGYGTNDSLFESGYFDSWRTGHDFENPKACGCYTCGFSDPNSKGTDPTSAKTEASANSREELTTFAKAQAKHTLDLLEKFTLSTFSEVTETTSGDANYGQLRFLSLDLDGALGRASLPGMHHSAGDITIDNSPSPLIEDQYLKAGEDAYNTLIHEVGHAIGLDHPFGGTFAETESPGKSAQHTVMAYNVYSATSRPSGYLDGDGAMMGYYPQTWMIDDIATLQYMYGANEQTNRGDNTFDVSNLSDSTISDGIIYQTIWDAAGNDTISWNGQTTVSAIDLTAGSHSFFGELTSIADTNFMDGHDSLTVGDGILGIAYGADIENAIGGTNNDTLTGNSLDNILNGGPGKDVLTGGSGADTFEIGSGASGITLATADTILDFSTTIDKINITDSQIGAGEAVVSDGASFADFSALAADAGTNFTDTDNTSNVQMYFDGFGTGHGYVFIDSDNDGTLNTDDNLIILTGVNLSTEIAISDIV